VAVRHQAQDALSLGDAAKVLERVPPYVGRYAVTHQSDPDRISEIISSLPVDSVQLHDELILSELLEIRRRHPQTRIVKALHVLPGGLEEDPDQWARHVDAFILDSVDTKHDRIGGTGLVHDWSISAKVVQELRLPVILAGGLNPSNVEAAVEVVRPWAVNVNSGVEVDGYKSEELVRAFVQGANR
jgi:phosphoribosylanthranilate isomerase